MRFNLDQVVVGSLFRRTARRWPAIAVGPSFFLDGLARVGWDDGTHAAHSITMGTEALTPAYSAACFDHTAGSIAPTCAVIRP